MSILFFDIETVVSAEGKKLVEACEVSAPANYKDEAKIAAYVAEKRKELLDKAALYWWTGKIVCISYADIETNETWEFVSDDEAELLTKFFTLLSEKFPFHRLVGKNSDEFDLPWLRARAMRHDLGLVKQLRVPQFSDVQKIFGWGRAASQVTSLENTAKGLDLELEKTGKGADVAALWKEGRHGELAKYCLNDTLITQLIYKRYAKEFAAGSGGSHG